MKFIAIVLTFLALSRLSPSHISHSSHTLKKSMTTFNLNSNEFIELNKLLKINNLVNSGGEAKVRIQEGEATVNGQPETQVRKKLRVGDRVEFGGETITIHP